eukprot:Hpha_TRINITY_DN26502_c0_g1::TRINITY_DN26502_c0_g1_i1::g.113038::m.113038
MADVYAEDVPPPSERTSLRSGTGGLPSARASLRSTTAGSRGAGLYAEDVPLPSERTSLLSGGTGGLPSARASLRSVTAGSRMGVYAEDVPLPSTRASMWTGTGRAPEDVTLPSGSTPAPSARAWTRRTLPPETLPPEDVPLPSGTVTPVPSSPGRKRGGYSPRPSLEDLTPRDPPGRLAAGDAAVVGALCAAGLGLVCGKMYFAVRWRAVQERLAAARGLGQGRSGLYSLVTSDAPETSAISTVLSAAGFDTIRATPGMPRRSAAGVLPARSLTVDVRREAWKEVYARCAKCGLIPEGERILMAEGLCSGCVAVHQDRLRRLRTVPDEVGRPGEFSVGQAVTACERICFSESHKAVEKGDLGVVIAAPGKTPGSVAEVQFGVIVFDAKAWHVRPVSTELVLAGSGSPPSHGGCGEVCCPERRNGCRWTGPSHHLLIHSRECGYRPLQPRPRPAPEWQRREGEDRVSVPSALNTRPGSPSPDRRWLSDGNVTPSQTSETSRHSHDRRSKPPPPGPSAEFYRAAERLQSGWAGGGTTESLLCPPPTSTAPFGRGDGEAYTQRRWVGMEALEERPTTRGEGEGRRRVGGAFESRPAGSGGYQS